MSGLIKYSLSETRSLFVCSLKDAPDLDALMLKAGYAVLLPACSDKVDSSFDLVASLVRDGAGEFCMVGPNSEANHDAIDGFLEDIGLFATTTAMDDVKEGVEYFIFGAGAGQCDLLAFSMDSPTLHSHLLREAGSIAIHPS